MNQRTANYLDRFLGGLLTLSAAGHTVGTLAFYQWPSEIFVWSLGASLAAFLLAAINLLRVNRPTDRALAGICLAGSPGWLALVIAFGVVIGQMLDPRVLMHGVAAVGLTVMSIRTLTTSRYQSENTTGESGFRSTVNAKISGLE